MDAQELAATVESQAAELDRVRRQRDDLAAALKHVIVVGYHEDCRRCISARAALAAARADDEGGTP